jgi:hypothetical protein
VSILVLYCDDSSGAHAGGVHAAEGVDSGAQADDEIAEVANEGAIGVADDVSVNIDV